MIMNKKAYHDYFVEETIECGISLRGSEVKSIREGKCSISNAWGSVQNGNLELRGMHINAWGTSNAFDIDEDRVRRLLVHKKEIIKLQDYIEQAGYTLIPLRVYFNARNKCKVEIGVCKGKHLYDKRQALRDKQVSRDINRVLKGRGFVQ